MIFAREINDPLTSLVKKVDEINVQRVRDDKKMGSFVVFLSDEKKKEGMEKKLKDFSDKQKLEKTALTIWYKPSLPSDYEINEAADVTVILYVEKKVKVNRAYKKGEFKAAEVDKILKELPALFKEYDE